MLPQRTPGGPAAALALLLLASSAPPGAARQAPGAVAEPSAAAVTVLRTARMLGVVASELVAGPVLVVEGERIAAVGPAAASPEVPEDAREVDLGDITLLPGLIDLQNHLTYTPENFLPDLGRHPSTPTATHALVGERSARATLQAGITTVRDLGACCFADVTVARAIEAGLAVGPRGVPAGYVLTITGGNCDQTIAELLVVDGGPEQGIVDSPEEIVEAVRYQVRHSALVIKACVDGQKFSSEEIRVMADEAHRRGVKLATHVWEVESVRAAVEGGADTVEHVTFLDDAQIEAMLEKGSALVPTIHVSLFSDLDALPPAIQERFVREQPQWRASLRRAIAAGLPVGFGSDAGEIPYGENAKELVGLVEHGMSPLEAIRAATLVGARVLDVDDRGAIEAGKLADVIAVPGNPLEDMALLQDVRFVMKGGKIYRSRSTTAELVQEPATAEASWQSLRLPL